MCLYIFTFSRLLLTSEDSLNSSHASNFSRCMHYSYIREHDRVEQDRPIMVTEAVPRPEH